MSHGTNEFDLELERELHRVLDPIVAGPIPLRHSPRRFGFMVKLLSSAGAALAAKTATGVAIAALAVGTAGAATEAVITKSLNPADWGHQISLEVRTVTGEQPQPGGSSGTSGTTGNASTTTTNAAPGTQVPVPSTATPGHGLPVQVPTVTPPALPAVSPIALPSASPPACGPLNNEIGVGCK